jgi:O-antigen ligase
MTWERASAARVEERSEGSIWTEVHAWIALLPALFITANGRIQTDLNPVAFRFTAMEEDSPVRRIARVACSALILYLLSTRLREIAKVCWKAKMFLALPGLAFVSALWSQDPAHTLVSALNLVLTTLFAVYLYVRYPGKRLMDFLIFSAVVPMLLCIFLVIFVPKVGIDSYQQDSWRGIFGQRNNCAMVCTLFLAVALHYRARSFADQVARATVFVLSLLFIVMSGSRQGWIFSVLALALTLGLRLIARMRSLDRIFVLMAAAVPAALLIFLIATNVTQLLYLMDKDPTITQRTVIWAEVLPSIVKQPFAGYGYLSYWQGLNGESMGAVLTTGWMEGQAQDGYLDVLLGLGVIGLAPVLWMFVRAFVQAVKAIERRIAGPVVLLATVLLPLVLAENVGESSILTPLGIPWFYALLAFLVLAFSKDLVEAV